MQTLGKGPSFGFGDRTGFATPGHVAAMQRAGDGILPLFAQQSIREMSRTGRTPTQVMAEAVAGMEAAGWTGPCGADADHLKTAADIASCAVDWAIFCCSARIPLMASLYWSRVMGRSG